MRTPLRRIIAVIVATQVVLALATGIAVYAFVQKVDRNVSGGETIDHLVDGDESDGPSGPLNILLLGSDERDCEGCGIDRAKGGGGSDTSILLHVSADRKTAYGVSIPRDALTDRPECEGPDGAAIPARANVMWNSAYAEGGAACTVRQLELLTDIHINHYVTLNFAGFKDMVDAIDGVTVCIPEDIDDDQHNIHLDAGTQTLMGDDSLSYVRDRFSTPNSDIGRMRRQQYFMASMAKQVISAGTLTRPDRLMGFAVALTESIETDDEITSAGDLVDLASELRGIGLDNINFITVPYEAFPESSPNWGRLRILPRADQLWERIAEDRPLGQDFGSGAISASDSQGSGGSSGSGGSGGSGSSSSGAPSTTDDDPTPGTDGLSEEEAAANGLC